MDLAFKSNYPQIARESGFKLRQFKDGPLDWRLVGSMEVDRILREQQFEHIDAVLFHLSEVPLASMLDSNVLDSGVAKYFTLSQLALQYLIFCRKFLDESLRTLHENIIKLETQNLKLRTVNQEHTDNILHLHKKLSQIEAINEIVFPCHVCTKNFVSNDALNIHLSKKHLKSPSDEIQGKKRDQTLIDTIKLELEIKQLKERLNLAEQSIRQASEIKKKPTEQINKINSGTQIDFHTKTVGNQVNFDKTKVEARDVGTQCDLFETKELDSTEEAENRSESEFKKKTSSHGERVDDDNRADILFDIQEKISQLESSQKTYSAGNQQSIDDIKMKLGEIAEFLETQIRQNAENETKESTSPSHQVLPSQSMDELHKMLSNMFVEVSQKNFETTNRIITNIEKNYEHKLSTLEVEKKIRKPRQKKQDLGTQFPIVADSVEHGDGSIGGKTFSRHSSLSVEDDKNRTPSDTDGESSSSSSSTSLVESNRSFVSRTVEPDDSKAHKLENKMAFYGLDSNTQSISTNEVAKISNHILQQRSALQQRYPTFNKTRSRLSKLVEQLTSTKKALSKREQNDAEVDITKQRKKHLMQTDKSIVSKKHVDMALMPPIKKPTRYVPHNNRDVIKPVPLPRRHVMFHAESKQNSPK